MLLWRRRPSWLGRHGIIRRRSPGGGWAPPPPATAAALSSSAAPDALARLLEERRQAPRPWKWYACGPTVYDMAHLGHARTYVCQDVVRRVLTQHFGQAVTFVMGVTDVDDKILQRAQERKEDPRALARRCEAEFWADMRALNVQAPTAVVRVTEHMDAIVAYIQQIEKHGAAYETLSGLYFDVAAFSRQFTYGGTLRAQQPPDVQGAGDAEVVGRDEKRDPRDFVLWKRSKPGEESLAWDSPWGRGRPGWHIECSAMTHHLLGPRLDIHSGGVDLCFPHHTNEMAQCDAFRGTQEPPWVAAWLHTGHLYIQGLKMSKSLRNFISVRDCLRTHHPDDFRLFCLQKRYGANVDYSDTAMLEARSLRRQLMNFVSLVAQLHQSSGSSTKRWEAPERALMEDLGRVEADVDTALLSMDTPKVLRLLQALVTKGHAYQQRGGDEACVKEVLENVARYVAHVLDLFGLQSVGTAQAASSFSPHSPSTADLAGALVDFRARVRAAALQKGGTEVSDLSQSLLRLCDDFRDQELARLGLQVKDLGAGKCHWTLEAAPQDAAVTPAHQAKAAPPKATIPLAELFKQGPYLGQFAAYDAAGIPTADAQGAPLSKTLRTKLEKKHARHAALVNK